MKPINSNFFVNNRAKLRELFTGTAPIVITANGLIQQSTDNPFPFKQDSSFFYLTGINEDGVLLVMDRIKDYLILPNRPKFSDISYGNINIEELSRISGITEILDNQEGLRRLSTRLKRSKHVAVLGALPAYIEEYGFYSNPARAHLITRIKELNADISFLDIRKHITKLRIIKQPEEIESIQTAIDITAQTIKKIYKNISKYKFEYQVEALIISEFRYNNSRQAFTNVASSGKNAVAIHHSPDETPLKEDELLVLDIGAEINNYSADITRTLPIGGKITKRQNQVFDAVLEVQKYAYSLLKPGVVYKDYETLVEHFMGEKLRELGLISTIDRESVRKYYPHLTSHFLGLDTHDPGDYETVYKENMVITVEPGIYIPEEGIGIRIEDDVVFTANGIKILSSNLPSSFI